MDDSFETVHACALEAFARIFGSLDGTLVTGVAPGRVNLIGEHTDYNDGFVFPIALSLVTVVVGRRNDNNICRVVTTSDSADDPKDVSFGLEDLRPGKPKWANYVKGVVANFRVPLTHGFDAVVATNVPIGGGVSSSASLEVAVYSFLEALTGNIAESLTAKALACQSAEHQFVGMPCGIMDQFISTMATEGCALLIDCLSLTAESIPLCDPELKIVVVNSNVRHELTGSEYPTRRKQCESASAILGVKSLRFAKQEDLERSKDKFDSETFRRARHVIGEIERTSLSAEALKSRDYKKFGELMLASHMSLRDDYEVSCPELDELVKIAMTTDGVYGSRMTGGGFGGCTVTLVKAGAVDSLVEKTNKEYSGTATVFVCSASSGARSGKTEDFVKGLLEFSDARQFFPLHL